MIRSLSRVVTVALATVLLTCQTASFARNDVMNVSGISDLAWIAGSWQTDSSGRLISDEHWAKPAGGVMIGMSRTIAGDNLVSFESLRIEQRGDAIFYVASVKGRCPGTDFKLTRATAQEVIFENPEHDFPKRIIYRKKSATEMTAQVDAGEGTKSQVFTYHSITDK